MNFEKFRMGIYREWKMNELLKLHMEIYDIKNLRPKVI